MDDLGNADESVIDISINCKQKIDANIVEYHVDDKDLDAIIVQYQDDDENSTEDRVETNSRFVIQYSKSI